jgi:hypothetical protein
MLETKSFRHTRLRRVPLITAGVVSKKFVKILLQESSDFELTSAIGHEDLARIVSKRLGVELPTNRISVTLTPDDVVVVIQYTGPRLPEGTTKLPKGAKITYWLVRLVKP